MKKILLLAISLLTIAPALTAKDKDKDKEVKIVLVKEENSNEYYYEDVVPVEGVSKEEMFKRAKVWVLQNLKTSDNNIQFDENSFSIINEATIVLTPTKSAFWGVTTGMANFKLNIQFKEGKYKFRFDNIVIFMKGINGSETLAYGELSKSNMKSNKNHVKHVQNDSNEKFRNLSIQLEQAIKTNTASQDDW